MNITQISSALRVAVQSWADDQSPALNLKFDNFPKSLPEATSHALFSVLPGDSELVQLGVRTWRTVGIATLKVLSPLDLGEKSNFDIVDSFGLAFRSRTINNVVTTRTPRIIRVGRAGSYWQHNVVLPWFSDTN